MEYCSNHTSNMTSPNNQTIELPSIDFSNIEEFLNDSHLIFECPILTPPLLDPLDTLIIDDGSSTIEDIPLLCKGPSLNIEEDDTPLDPNFCLVLDDLIAEGPQSLSFPNPPYLDTDAYEKKFQKVYTKLLRYVAKKHRHMVLAYAYYLGQLLEDKSIPRSKRMQSQRSITTYYSFATRRVYQIYKHNPVQILYTKETTLKHIQLLHKEDFEVLAPKEVLPGGSN